MEQCTKATSDCTNNSIAHGQNNLIAPLRAEIVESQQARIDLLKYKLIAIAALGSIGLGLGGDHSNSGNIMILALIPLVCLYVDLLCYHNTMRILVIGQFFSKQGCIYENFISEVGGILYIDGIKSRAGYLFELEDVALQGSSIFLSLILIVIGFFCKNYMLMFTGFAGMISSYFFHKWFEKHKDKLFKVVKRIEDKQLDKNKN